MVAKHPPVAVVGVSALFPGSPEAERFWRNIVEGADLFSDVPETHWRPEDYFDADPRTPDKVYATRGGFLPPVDFAPMDFGIPPNVVPATDTAQLLALRVAQQVLEDFAGGDISGIDRERISVVLGASGGTEMSGYMSGRLHRPIWERGLRAAGLTDDELTAFSDSVASGYTPWQENTFPGLLGNVIAGRIANRFDLGGTNCVVDAACASSLAAIEIALHELYLREADMVIAGGVDAFNDIFMFMCFAKVTALSRTGDCRPFSDQSDGTMLGEGISMLALKRLDDAERDGDRIYAVIRGIGTSSDGRAKSIYAPSPDGQAKALRRAYDAAGYGPETVGLVEAHGTGTKAGDVAEFTALRRVFDESGRTDRQWCAVGSVKSQVGHTKGAAGACGLFKTVMALHHKVLPPTIKIDRPNPGLEIESSPFYLSTATKPWIAEQNVPRRAAVSAFGFGGTNFHITLEEYAGAGNHAQRFRSWDSELIVLGADSATALSARAAELAASLVDAPDMLAYAARSTQSAYDAAHPHRLAVVATGVENLRALLGEAAEKLAAPGVEASFNSPKGYSYSSRAAGPVALLFPGQGSQYVGMGADIPQLHEPALAPWETARAGLLNADRDLHQVVWPKTAFTEADRAAQSAELTKTEWAQPGIGAHSLSLLSVVRSLGITPAAVGGHSFGEVTALCAAGVFGDDAALLIARARGALMAQAAASSDGAMCAVTASAEDVTRLLGEWGLPVVIANHNAPNQVVLSGDRAAVADAAQRFTAAGHNARLLDVATAFHSEIVSAAATPFGAYLAGIPFGVPQVPVYANATAAPYTGSAEQMQATLANQIAQPVRFVEQLQAMWAAGARTFIEVGPGSVLTNLVGKCLAGQDHVAVALDAKGRNGIRSLWLGLAQLAAAGVPMNFEALWADYRHGDDPRTRQAPKLLLKLNGTNYGRPDIHREPVDRSAEKSTPRSDHNGHATVTESTMTPTDPLVPTANGLPAPIPTHVPMPVQPAAVPMVTSPLMSGPGAEMVTHMVGALGSMQQTIAHLQGLLQTLVSNTGMMPMPVTQMTVPGAPVVVPAQPAPAPPTPYGATPIPTSIPAPPPPPAPPAAPSAPVMPAPPAAAPAPAPVATMPAPPVAAPVAAAPAPVVVAPAPVAAAAPAAAPAAVGVDLVGDMLAVVADKTGYPVEMLDLSMALEADLGIDSIKRVEILSAVQDRVPSLPEVDTATMAALVTLREIVDYLQSLMGPVAAPVAAAAPAPAPASAPVVVAPAPVAAAAPAAAPAVAGVDLVGDMLAVVADKTGYPVEMLDLSMALEADLGIDSIKRVEILSAVQDRVPSLPEVDTATMAALVTLREIVDYLQSLMGPVAAPVAAAAPAPAPAPAPVVVAPAPVAAAAPAVAPAAVAGVDLVGDMLAVVADKTGYPVEMLDLSMALEADLGIDSIKRVEILSAVQDRVPSLPEVDTATMAALVTLREIVDYLQSLIGSPPPNLLATNGSSAGDRAPFELAGAEVARYTVSATAAPVSGMGMPGLYTAKTVEIVTAPAAPADLAATGDALAAVLRSNGIRAAVVPAPSPAAEAVVHLGGLRRTADREQALALNRELFADTQHIAAQFAERGGVFVTVQDTGGTFGLLTDPGTRAWSGGIGALAKTAAQEWTSAQVKAIDLAVGHRSPATVAEQIADEILAGGPELEVGLGSSHGRITLVANAQQVTTGTRRIGPQDVIVVSGGARGVTAGSVIALAQQTGAAFVLIGRTELSEEPAETHGLTTDAELKRALLGSAAAQGLKVTPKQLEQQAQRILADREVRATLAALTAAGSRVRYAAADVRDAAQLTALLDGVRNDFGPITGLVHGAGVLADAPLHKKTLDGFDRVFETKVGGLCALLDATAGDALKVICLFSSVAARSGNVGQSDYAMANEILNKVALAEQARRGPSCLVRALGWGPWDSGMVTPGLKAMFESRGISLIPLADGARAFVAEILDGDTAHPEVTLGDGVLAGLPTHPIPPEGRSARVLAHVTRQPYLLDHRVQGNVVLPVVQALEWFVRMAQACRPGYHAERIVDLKVLRGVTLPAFEKHGNPLLVRCVPCDERPEQLTLTLSDLDGSTTYYSARLEMRSETTDIPAAPDAVTGGQVLDHDACYRGGALFHGPAFAVLDSVDCAQTTATAELSGLLAVGWAGEGWATDPAALDGCLQAALVWSYELLGRNVLPLRIGEIIRYRYGALGTGLRCVLTAGDAKTSRAVCDLDLLDADGRPVAALKRLELYPYGS